MPATSPHMFTVVRVPGRDGRSRPHFISLPWVTALVREPEESPQRYFELPDEEPPPAPKPRCGNFGARPRRNGKELTPLKD